MLRGFVLLLGGVMLAGGALALVFSPASGAGFGLLVFGALLLIGTLFEQRYRPDNSLSPGGNWEFSGEKFLDPQSGEPVEVWTERRTGERRYLSRRN